MLPGSMRLCSAPPCVMLASATVGTAWAVVQVARSCLLRARLVRPLAAMAPAATRATRPTSKSRRGLGVLTGCEDMRFNLLRLGLVELAQAPPLRSGGHGRGRR